MTKPSGRMSRSAMSQEIGAAPAHSEPGSRVELLLLWTKLRREELLVRVSALEVQKGLRLSQIKARSKARAAQKELDEKKRKVAEQLEITLTELKTEEELLKLNTDFQVSAVKLLARNRFEHDIGIRPLDPTQDSTCILGINVDSDHKLFDNHSGGDAIISAEQTAKDISGLSKCKYGNKPHYHRRPKNKIPEDAKSQKHWDLPIYSYASQQMSHQICDNSPLGHAHVLAHHKCRMSRSSSTSDTTSTISLHSTDSLPHSDLAHGTRHTNISSDDRYLGGPHLENTYNSNQAMQQGSSSPSRPNTFPDGLWRELDGQPPLTPVQSRALLTSLLSTLSHEPQSMEYRTCMSSLSDELRPSVFIQTIINIGLPAMPVGWCALMIETLRQVGVANLADIVYRHLLQGSPTDEGSNTAPLHGPRPSGSTAIRGTANSPSASAPSQARAIAAAPTSSSDSSNGGRNGSPTSETISRSLRIDAMAFGLKHKIAQKLNIENDHGKDWRALAEKVGIPEVTRQNIKQNSKEKAMDVLNEWQRECDQQSPDPARDATAGNLHVLLMDLCRRDVASLLNFHD